MDSYDALINIWNIYALVKPFMLYFHTVGPTGPISPVEPMSPVAEISVAIGFIGIV